MNFQETMEYFSSFPPFSPAAIVSGEEAFNLNAIRELLRRLGNPEKRLKFVHVAGTNGKGSTSSYLKSIMVEAGYQVGFFSSPALIHFTEQIRINDEEISEEAVARITTKVRAVADSIADDSLQAPSAYEVTCAVAFLYFLEAGCDLVILEVGLGGRLDGTNVIPTPLLAIITSISFDHMEILGHTLPEIAKEKGGIIKKDGAVLLYPQSEDVTEVIRGLCSENEADLFIPSTPTDSGAVFNAQNLPIAQRFVFENQEYVTGLLGSYQRNNASMAIAAAHILREKGYTISDEAITEGIEKSRWMGRFEIVHHDPMILLDGSHNVEGAKMLRDNLMRYFPERKVIFIAGVLADKQYDEMLETVSDLAKCFITVTPDSQRALSSEDLSKQLIEKGHQAYSANSLEEAFDLAKNSVSGDALICAFGSLYYIGLFRQYLMSLSHENSEEF